MPINQILMAKLKVNGHSSVVWYWSGDPMVPRSNPLLVRKFLLLSLLIWKGGFEILPNNTWDLLKKAYGTSKKLRFQFRGQLNKPFSEPTYLYTNLRLEDPQKFSTSNFFNFLKNKHQNWLSGTWQIWKGTKSGSLVNVALTMRQRQTDSW